MIHNKPAMFNLARVVFWLGLTPVSYFLGWLDKVTFVALLSIWALVETAWSAYESSNDKKLIKKLDRIIDQNEEILHMLESRLN